MGCRVVLLAEDDVLLRNLVRHTLEAAGFLVLAAADGLEALALSHTYPGTIDVLLTDVDMPNLDGISLFETVQKQRPEVLVLVMSGGTSHLIDIETTDVRFLRKPFRPDVLVQMIRDLFREDIAQSGHP